jgi:hypothetical protein
MPLWKVYHPAGAYTAQDKRIYPKGLLVCMHAYLFLFYVVFILRK